MPNTAVAVGYEPFTIYFLDAQRNSELSVCRLQQLVLREVVDVDRIVAQLVVYGDACIGLTDDGRPILGEVTDDLQPVLKNDVELVLLHVIASPARRERSSDP